MQANRTTANRRSPWRTALDTALGLFGASRMPASAPATSSVDETAAVFIAPDATSKAPTEPEATRAPHEATLGTVDFLAQLDDTLRFQYVSDASIGFIGYHRDYLGMLTLHDLVPSTEADELNALVARAHASGKLETATLSLVKSLTYPICVELRDDVAPPRRACPASRSPRSTSRTGATTKRSCSHALHHDPLTGLDNLTALIPALDAVQAEAEHTRTQAALCWSISTTISASTARSATTPATTCCAKPRGASSTRPGTARSSRAIASDEFAVLRRPPRTTRGSRRERSAGAC